MMGAARFFVVSLPLQGSAAATWAGLQQGIATVAFDTPTYKFHVPDLRVGTLDTLLTLGDELTKGSTYVEGVSHKVRRQIEELERTTSATSSSLFVDGVPLSVYVTRFSWNLGRYPLDTPLNDTMRTIQEIVFKLEDDLKVRVAQYTAVKTQLSTTLRKQTGSMAVRDLTTLVRAEDIVSTEHLTTLFVVVSKSSQHDWLRRYETLSEFVVPRSTKKLQEDAEYALYTVTLFRHVAESFTSAAREKGFQVRELTFDPLGQHHFREEVERLQQEHAKLRHALLHWCYASFGEVFSAWMHLCAIRIFTESILRYGLPPAFLAAVLAPSAKNERKVRRMLDQLVGGATSGGGSFWKGEDDDPAMVGLAGGGDPEVYPYVSLTINLSS